MKKIPIWVLVIAGFCAIAPLVSVIIQYIDPNIQFGGYSVAALSLAGPFGMYLSRKLATALVMAIALFKREAGMLTCAFLFILFTYVLDIINGLIGGGEVSVLSVVFIVLALPALWKLWPMMKVRE